MSLSYRQFIDGINSGTIVKAEFQVKNYAHYKRCFIERVVKVFSSGYSTVSIDIRLTKDSEHFSFPEKFDERHKIFDMGRNGTFTLKQMWDKLEFISIDYAT